MLSNLLELAGLASLVAGVDYLANPGWALIAAAPCLLFLGLAAEGLHPVSMGRTAAVDLRGRAAAVFARRRAERQQRQVTQASQ